MHATLSFPLLLFCTYLNVVFPVVFGVEELGFGCAGAAEQD
jgi:hypothetical protein